MVIGMLGAAYALAGHTGDARLLLNELADRSSRQFVDPLAPAMVYVGLGDWDNLERQLSLIVEQHGNFANVEHTVGPYLDKLADQPRFRELFRRLSLAERKLPSGIG